MVVALLPSEIARLVLNYLDEQNLKKTFDTFLDECKCLAECREYLSRGIAVPKTIHGKTLADFLVIDSKEIDGYSTASVSTQTEIELTPRRVNPSHLKESRTASAVGINESSSPFSITTNHHRSTSAASSSSSSAESTPAVSAAAAALSDQDGNTGTAEKQDGDLNGHPKRRRILIGKNITKLPQFSVSTLERQLNSIINDPANHIVSNSPPQQQQSSSVLPLPPPPQPTATAAPIQIVPTSTGVSAAQLIPGPTGACIAGNGGDIILIPAGAAGGPQLLPPGFMSSTSGGRGGPIIFNQHPAAAAAAAANLTRLTTPAGTFLIPTSSASTILQPPAPPPQPPQVIQQPKIVVAESGGGAQIANSTSMLAKTSNNICRIEPKPSETEKSITSNQHHQQQQQASPLTELGTVSVKTTGTIANIVKEKERKYQQQQQQQQQQKHHLVEVINVEQRNKHSVLMAALNGTNDPEEAVLKEKNSLPGAGAKAEKRRVYNRVTPTIRKMFDSDAAAIPPKPEDPNMNRIIRDMFDQQNQQQTAAKERDAVTAAVVAADLSLEEIMAKEAECESKEAAAASMTTSTTVRVKRELDDHDAHDAVSGQLDAWFAQKDAGEQQRKRQAIDCQTQQNDKKGSASAAKTMTLRSKGFNCYGNRGQWF